MKTPTVDYNTICDLLCNVINVAHGAYHFKPQNYDFKISPQVYYWGESIKYRIMMRLENSLSLYSKTIYEDQSLIKDINISNVISTWNSLYFYLIKKLNSISIPSANLILENNLEIQFCLTCKIFTIFKNKTCRNNHITESRGYNNIIKELIYYIMPFDAKNNKYLPNVKIGTSTNPARRKYELQTGSAFPLKIVYQEYNNEKVLHKTYHHLRLNGEWFSYDDILKKDLSLKSNIEINT